MKTSGNLIRFGVEFPTRVKSCHHHFRGGLFFLFMERDRDASTVVDNGHAGIHMNGHIDLRAVADNGFIDAVIHDFVNEVMKTFGSCTPDIHGRPLADGFQPFKDFNAFCGVFFLRHWL